MTRRFLSLTFLCLLLASCNLDSMVDVSLEKEVLDVPTSNSLTSTEDDTLQIKLGPATANNSVVTYTITTPPAYGTLDSCGAIDDFYYCTYTSAADYNGADTFAYSANDGRQIIEASVSLTVTSTNDLPTLDQNSAPVLRPGASVVIDSTYLSGSDLESSSSGLIYTLLSLPSNATLKLDGVALSISDTFTEADVIAGLLTFEHTMAGDETDQTFTFSLQDADGAYATNASALSPATFTVDMNAEQYEIRDNGDGSFTYIVQPGLTTGRDTAVVAQNPTTNFGASTGIWTTNEQYSNWGGINYQQRTIIAFDLSPIPLTATITNAKISFYFCSYTNLVIVPHYLHPYTAAFDENTVTWSNATMDTTTDLSAGVNIYDVYGWYALGNANANMNAYVQNYLGSSATFLLRGSPLAGWNHKSFYSSEYTVDPSLRPYIEVTYTP